MKGMAVAGGAVFATAAVEGGSGVWHPTVVFAKKIIPIASRLKLIVVD